MDSMQIAMSGLDAVRQALQTNSHNIANAATEGYHRQRVDLTAALPVRHGAHYLGSGVQVTGVQRAEDQFVTAQLRDVTAEQRRLDSLQELGGRIDALMGEQQASLTPELQGFFNALQQLSTAPASTANRQEVMSRAQNLTARFHVLDGQLDALEQESNGRLRAEVTDINALARGIADLNRKIETALGVNQGELPNDLIDKRDALLQKLAEHTAIHVTPSGRGMTDVYIGNGLALVTGARAGELSVTGNEYDPQRLEVAANGHTVSGLLRGGSLGGVLDFRRDLLDPTRNELGRLATVLGQAINDQHRKGMDLQGRPGGDFFRLGAPRVWPSARNTGGAELSATVVDATALRGSDYRLEFDGSRYTVTRLSDQTQRSFDSLPAELDGLRLTLDGAPAAGDRFLIRPTVQGAGALDLALTGPDRLAAASPLRAVQPAGNLGHLSPSPVTVTDPADPDLARPVELRFTDAGHFDVVDADSGATLASGQTFTDGAPIALRGWRLTVRGQPAAGDVLRIEPNRDGVGDNTNGNALAGLQYADLVGGSATLQEGWSGLVGRVGNQLRQISINAEAQSALRKQATDLRDARTGVNLDEEAVRLQQLQQAYQANAQVIATANSLFDAILNVFRG